MIVFLNSNRISGPSKYFELGSSDFCRIILNRWLLKYHLTGSLSCNALFIADVLQFKTLQIWKFRTRYQKKLIQDEGMYICSCRPSRNPNGKCLLGALLLGARDSAWWTNAQRQGGRRWLVFYILPRDRSRETCSSCCFCWLGAICRR